VSEIEMPPGGLSVAWPEGDQPAQQSIRRGQGRWIGTELRIRTLPFTISFPRAAGAQ
jgi:hypothetical protein